MSCTRKVVSIFSFVWTIQADWGVSGCGANLMYAWHSHTCLLLLLVYSLSLQLALTPVTIQHHWGTDLLPVPLASCPLYEYKCSYSYEHIGQWTKGRSDTEWSKCSKTKPSSQSSPTHIISPIDCSTPHFLSRPVFPVTSNTRLAKLRWPKVLGALRYVEVSRSKQHCSGVTFHL